MLSRIKKGEGQGKEKCHAKSMMSNEANERLKRDTQHLPLVDFFLGRWKEKTKKFICAHFGRYTGVPHIINRYRL